MIAKTETLSATEKAVREMLIRSTGISFLDSGRENGRHWQRNQEKPPWLEPQITYEAHKYGDGQTEFFYLINIYHYLTETFELDEGLNKALTVYDRLTGGSKHVLELASEFGNVVVKSRKMKETSSRVFYSYNEPDAWNLSQDIHVCLVGDGGEFEKLWITSVHQGADARGGFSYPLVLRPIGDDFISFVTVKFAKDIYFDNFGFGEWTDRDGSGADEEFQEHLDACELKDGKLFYEGQEIKIYVEFLI